MAKNKHITEPDVFGFQVRIVRRGKESSRYFSHKLWGNKNKSLQAAITWRDQMLVVLKAVKRVFSSRPKIKPPPASRVYPEPSNMIIEKIKIICVIRFFGSAMANRGIKPFRSATLKK